VKVNLGPQPLRVIIPCLDEEGAVGPLVRAVSRHLDLARDRVIVVDNGSRDRTAEVARAAGAEVVAEPLRGYGRACMTGLLAAADGIAVFLDGDGADDSEDLGRVIELVRAGPADLVVGVRRDREPGSMTLLQRAGNRVATAGISLICGVAVTDLGSMRAIRVDRLLALEPSARTYGWSTEVTVKALRAGYRYLEVPVSHHRRVGISKVSGTISGSLRAGFRIPWTVLRWSRWRPAAAAP
jgi:glycosyltransferase involved in cell wall biosynthesis